MLCYVVSLYLLTYRENLNIISNVLAFILVSTIAIDIILVKKEIFFNHLLFIFSLFTVFCLISVLYSLSPEISMSKVTTLSLIFLVMFSLANYLDSPEKIRKFILSFVYSGFIASVYIILDSDFSNVERFGGTLGNVNAVGMMISTSLIFCLYLFLTEKKYRYIVFITPMLPTVLLTGSRKALIFLILTFLFILYFNNRNKVNKLFKWVLILTTLLVIFYYLVLKIPLFYQVIGIRIESLFDIFSEQNISDRSLIDRSFMIKFGLEKFGNKPFVGYGIDNFRVLYGQAINGVGTYAHNNFIELLVDLGMVGCLLYYLTHIFLIVSLLKKMKRIEYEKMSIFFVSIIISYTILGMSLVYYDNKYMTFLMVAASIVGRGSNIESNMYENYTIEVNKGDPKNEKNSQSFKKA